MVSYNFATLKKIDIRKVWKNEASDFTNWLAELDNLQNLGDEIGVDIGLNQTEAPVGKFFVDILAKDENSGKHVVIENQLETTNHDHLGKIITYAAGFDASMVIWVVKEAREEHRKAIDWLNQYTDENVAFFLVKVEVWQIDDSPFAPKFEIISKPNDWAKTVKQSAVKGQISALKARQLEFWREFKNHAEENGTTLKLQKPNPQHWFNISIGTQHAYITLTINSKENVIRTEFYIRNNMDLYSFLEKRKDKIHELLGEEVVWMGLPGKKASRVKIEKSGSIDDDDEWKNHFQWLQEKAERFQEVFGEQVKTFQ